MGGSLALLQRPEGRMIVSLGFCCLLTSWGGGGPKAHLGKIGRG